MVTIKLKKSPAPSGPSKPERAPVRGAGSGVKRRPTLAEAQAQRAEREARYQEQLRQRFGDNPPPALARRGEPDSPRPQRERSGTASAPPRRDERRPAPESHGRPARDAREERDARYQDQLRQRFGDNPPPAFARRAEGDAFQGDPRRPPRDARQARSPQDARGGARDPRQAPYAGPRDDRRGGRPTGPRDDQRGAPYGGPRDDGRGAQRTERRPPFGGAQPQPGSNSAFGNRQAPSGTRDHERRPAPGRGPQHAPAQGPDSRREDHRRSSASRAAPPHRSRDEDDEDGPMHAEQPGSMRLSKRMSELGMASRREADEWIPKGWVRVDGRVVKELGSRVMPGQHITIDAKARKLQSLKVTVLINKPVGYVSGQAEDGYEPAVVLVTPQNQWREDRSSIQFVREHLRSLAPAGRLDIDSVGLLVLTQDGRIAKQLIGDDSEIDKEYLVRVQPRDGQPLSESGLALLNHGLELDGEALRPALVEWVNDDQLRFVLREGKKRQIRRMCEAVGLDVLGLKRVRIGRVMLGDLPPGQWRYLRGDESFAAPVEAPPQG